MIIDDDVEEFLEHFGVKGMKWGVRRNRRIDRLNRARSKDANVSTKLRALGNIGPVDFVKGRGPSGAFKRKSERLTAREKRRVAGKANAWDTLARVGDTRISDLVPVRTKNINKPGGTNLGDKAVVTAAGAAMALRVLTIVGKNAARNAA